MQIDTVEPAGYPSVGQHPVAPIFLEGAARHRRASLRGRIWVVIGAALLAFLLISARLIQLGTAELDTAIEGQARDIIQASRPPILDRNGLTLAMDLRVPSLYAEPRRIVDVAEAVDKLRTVLPDLDPAWLAERLGTNAGFVWIRRELTPDLADSVMALGLPGIDLIEESKRFYPPGSEISHVIGAVNVDNQGIAGMELAIDRSELAVLQEVGLARDALLEPKALTIDIRVQHAMRERLGAGIERFRAIAGAGVLLDTRSGEVLAMVSLPDFDPNAPATALEEAAFNRITNGTFELGSTFKSLTIAAALDANGIAIDDIIDAREGVRFGRYVLDHGKHQLLSVSDVFRYSDNIGTIRIMQTLGPERLRAFLGSAGFDARSPIELPERAPPRVPDAFTDLSAATASYGYGFAASPMHMASAFAALVNGGNYVPPTLFPRSAEAARALYRPIVDAGTSAEMIYLLRMNALLGSARNMEAGSKGYRAGGKTGTAEKVIEGRYSKTRNITVFTAAFPLDAPRYAMLVMLDEPKAEAIGTREAGWNVAVVAGEIIARIAPMLGIPPAPSALMDQQVLAQAGIASPN